MPRVLADSFGLEEDGGRFVAGSPTTKWYSRHSRTTQKGAMDNRGTKNHENLYNKRQIKNNAIYTETEE